MKVDVYTKAVLTVIALCLVWISFRSMGDISVANAQTTQPVEIVGWRLNGPIHVQISGVRQGYYTAGTGQPYSAPWDSLPVFQRTDLAPLKPATPSATQRP